MCTRTPGRAASARQHGGMYPATSAQQKTTLSESATAIHKLLRPQLERDYGKE